MFLIYLVKPAQSYDTCPSGNFRASVMKHRHLWVDIDPVHRTDRVHHTDRVHPHYMYPNKNCRLKKTH